MCPVEIPSGSFSTTSNTIHGVFASQTAAAVEPNSVGVSHSVWSNENSNTAVLTPPVKT